MQCNDTHPCAFAPLLDVLRHAAPDDREAQERAFWEELHDSAEETGDTIGDYDGPLTWARAV